MADYESTWFRLTNAFETGEVIASMVVDRVKGGLVVDLGVRGFLPASHVRIRNVHALDRLVGQSLRVKIIEVDRARKRVVVSHKDAVEEEREKRREQTIATIKENQIYKGVVRRITDYGAFMDLGGVDGLLHVTEMSWTRIDHPSEVLKVGDKVDVMVLRFDAESNRISLGRKQILPDPWEEAKDRFKVGESVQGTVSRVVPFGAFVKMETGIEGIIPNSELPGGRGAKAQDTLKVGDKVEAKVVNVRPGERRMTLSLRQIQQQEERREIARSTWSARPIPAASPSAISSGTSSPRPAPAPRRWSRGSGPGRRRRGRRAAGGGGRGSVEEPAPAEETDAPGRVRSRPLKPAAAETKPTRRKEDRLLRSRNDRCGPHRRHRQRQVARRGVLPSRGASPWWTPMKSHAKWCSRARPCWRNSSPPSAAIPCRPMGGWTAGNSRAWCLAIPTPWPGSMRSRTPRSWRKSLAVSTKCVKRARFG